MLPDAETTDRPLGILAAGGAMPFAVADAVRARGRDVIMFGMEGICDPVQIARFSHHWIAVAQFGRFFRLMRAEGVRDLVGIGTLVRPAIRDLRMDWGTLRVLPGLAAALRGGDDHALTGIGRLLERNGIRFLGITDVAPELLMPQGRTTRAAPDTEAETDIAIGRDLLRALSPFDVGQAVVVIGRHVVGIEGIEGTDALLARIAQLRADGRIRKAAGRGVLVKAPKAGQDLRFDLPTIGPTTIEGVAQAKLAGLAVMAGHAIVAEPQAMIDRADRASVFVVGFAP